MAPDPSIVGRTHEETSKENEVKAMDDARKSGSRMYRVASLVMLFASTIVCQFVVFFTLPGHCSWFFGLSRFQRWLWLSPLYLLGPYSAVALVGMFIWCGDRYEQSSFMHRWTWRFAICNLFASMLSPFGEIIRDCTWPQDLLIGKLFEWAYVLSYSASLIIVLILIRFKIQALSRGRALGCVWFDRMLGVMVFMLSATIFPAVLSFAFVRSMWRFTFATCFILTFLASTFLAFRIMYTASNAMADVALTWRPSNDSSQAAAVADAVRWTRWTAFASLFSMISTVALLVSLLVWMYQNFAPTNLRVVSDWLGALDFVSNAFCAACMSGLIGRQENLALEEALCDQIGVAPLQREMQEGVDEQGQGTVGAI